MCTNKLITNDNLVSCLSKALSRGQSGLKNIPSLIKRVIEEEAWKERTIEISGETVRFNSFMDFINAEPLEGLGTTFDMIWRICQDEPVVLDLLNKVTSRKRGNPSGNNQYTKRGNVDNVNNSSAINGNSQKYSYRRLKKDRPDLLELVIAGRMSANKAMIEAGFRKKNISITSNVSNVAKALQNNFSKDDLLDIIQSLIY